MKRLLIITFLLGVLSPLAAQPLFSLGLKGGVNTSKIRFHLEDYNNESITKGHFGAFARVGWGRLFIQPEAYFSAKGGDLSGNIFHSITSFNYKSVDVPVLLGVNLFRGKIFDMHFHAGPLFSFMTSHDIRGPYPENYFGDNYVGLQYGLGFDVLFLTLDFRMEHSLEKVYTYPEVNGKNKTFMISLGIEIF